MFLGLRTVAYVVEDLEAARDWYSKALGHEPYFDEPYYVGFNVGGFELGLHPPEDGGPGGLGGTEAAMSRLFDLGATVHGENQGVGEGILVASVVDTFGNLLGIIRNPHFRAADIE